MTVNAQSKKRGRPRKNIGSESPEMRGRSYWLGEVFIDQGWAWGNDFVEKEPRAPLVRCRGTLPLCLGKEDDVIPILKGNEPIPEDIHPRRRAVLEKILEETQDGGIKTASGASGLQRGGNAGALRHRKRDARRVKAREGLSHRKAHDKGKGVPGRRCPRLAETAG